MKGKDLVIDDSTPGKLDISWPLQSFNVTLEIYLDEQQIVKTIAGNKTIKWYLDLTTGKVKNCL